MRHLRSILSDEAADTFSMESRARHPEHVARQWPTADLPAPPIPDSSHDEILTLDCNEARRAPALPAEARRQRPRAPAGSTLQSDPCDSMLPSPRTPPDSQSVFSSWTSSRFPLLSSWRFLLCR